MWKNVKKQKNDIDQIGQLAVDILNTSGFYDDPNDSTRTLANMQTSAVVYARETYPYLYAWPIWVADPKAPLKPVGIEQVFDCVVEYTDGKRIRFIGTLDGIICNTQKDMRVTMADNKTASRMDRAWRESQRMKHQYTGYMACGSAIFGVPIWYARIYGCLIKPVFKGEDVHVENVRKTQEDVLHWGNWMRRQVEIFEEYQVDWEHAERRTHSCNRYFRPCALIPFCADSSSGRREQWDQMIDVIPSPSERAIVS